MKATALLFLLLLLSGLAVAEVYTIGTGGEIQSYVPYAGSQDYSWSKIIYPATELSNAGLSAGLIAGIGFHVGNSPTIYPVFNQQVYIRNTTAGMYLNSDTALPDISAFQNVYQASYTWTGMSWNHIMFNSPFMWDGTSSIEILWENWDGFYTNSYPSFSYTTTYAPMVVHQYDMYIFPSNTPGTPHLNRPNIQFITGETTIPDPAVLVAPANGGFTLNNTSLKWNTGNGMPSSYNIYFGTSSNPQFLLNQSVNNYQLTGLNPGTTYYWKIVPQNDLGQAANCPVWSFSTPGLNQLAQSFETSVPPPGWLCQGSDFWDRSTLEHSDGNASAYIDGNQYSQFTLSTPKLNIIAGSTLTFDMFSQYPTAALEIIYSPDRITWSLLQSVPNIDGNTWETKIVDISAIPGEYYIGFRTPLAGDNIYLDAVIGPQLISQLPGAPIPTYPNNQATNESIYPVFTWNNPSTGGIPTSYNIYLDSNSTPTTLIGSAIGNIYMLNTPLEYNSSYFWKLTAINEAGESVASTVFSFTTMSDPTISTFPWLVDFGTVAGDWPVANWTQLKGVFPTPTSNGSQWSRDDWVNVPASNNAARMNVFGTQRYGWLISPPINIPSEGYEVQFSLGLTDYTNPSPIEDPTSQLDDKFIVAMSDTRNMANPMILREWNNAGSQYVYNQIPHTGLVSNIPLIGITGIKYFAFYGESTLPGGDNDLYVDNITIRQIPAGGHLAASPPEWDYGQVIINNSVEKTFIISNNGYAQLNVYDALVSGLYFSSPEPFVPVSLAVGESFEFTVLYTPEVGGNHSGAITFSHNSGSSVVNLSAYCHDPVVTSFPWSEDFGTTTEDWPVADWTTRTGFFPNSESIDLIDWEQDDWLNHPSWESKAAKNICYQSNYNCGWLVTPGINLPTEGYSLSFDLGLTNLNQTEPIPFPLPSNDGKLLVVMSDSQNMTEPVIIREWNNFGSEYVFNDIPNTGTSVNITLDNISGIKYFAFYCESTTNGSYQADLMIDNVVISGPSGNPDSDIPPVAESVLLGNYPNPFNPETTICYKVKEAGFITLEIYNLKGRLVKTIVNENKAIGEYSVGWNGTDYNNCAVSSGVYLYKMKAGKYSSAKKMIMMK